MIQLYLKKLMGWLGIRPTAVSHTEKWVSALGGFLAIAVMLWSTHQFLDLDSSIAVIASMGATAVLLFAVPHSALSQPWPVVGGNLIASFIGVSCALAIEPVWLAASLAVGLTIISMYYLNCIHPPAGGAALIIVLGNEEIHQLGYQFLLTPVLLNLVIILMMAVGFNALFHWRRYPVFLQKPKPTAVPDAEEFSHADFLAALKGIDSFVDINENELKRILALAFAHRQKGSLSPEDIHLNGVYTNGKLGSDWAMRQIIDESKSDHPSQDWVIFEQLVGHEAVTEPSMTRSEFAHWAKHEMIKDNGLWYRKDPSKSSET